MAKIDASIEAYSKVTEGDLNAHFEKEAMTEYDLLFDSIRQLFGEQSFDTLLSKYGRSSNLSDLHASTQAKVEAKVKEQLEAIMKQVKPHIERLEQSVNNVDKSNVTLTKVLEQLEYVEIKQDQLKVLIHWAEQKHTEAVV